MIKYEITAVLAAFLVVGCGGNQESTEKLVLTGSSTVAPLAADIAKRFETLNPGVRIDVQTGGSSRGISDAASGLANIGMASRNLKDGEKNLTEHRIAIDGISVISHANNSASGLTRDQIIGIFTGKIKNWNAVGGPDREIVVVNKAEGRGTLEVFLKYAGLDSADVKADLIVGENQQAIKTVAGNPDAIGYVSIGAGEYESANGTAIKLLAVDEIEATSANVANGKYPISRPLIFITNGEPTGVAQRFIEYASGSEVVDLVKKHLYVAVGS